MNKRVLRSSKKKSQTEEDSQEEDKHPESESQDQLSIGKEKNHEDSLAKRRPRRTIKSNSKFDAFMYEFLPLKNSHSTRIGAGEFYDFQLPEDYFNGRPSKMNKAREKKLEEHLIKQEAEEHHYLINDDDDSESKENSGDGSEKSSSIQDEDRSSNGEMIRKTPRRQEDSPSKPKSRSPTPTKKHEPPKAKEPPALKKPKPIRPKPQYAKTRRQKQLLGIDTDKPTKSKFIEPKVVKPTREKPKSDKKYERRSKMRVDFLPAESSEEEKEPDQEILMHNQIQTLEDIPPLNSMVEAQREIPENFAKVMQYQYDPNNQVTYPLLWKHGDNRVILKPMGIQFNPDEMKGDEDQEPPSPKSLMIKRKDTEEQQENQENTKYCSLEDFLPDYDLDRSICEESESSSESEMAVKMEQNDSYPHLDKFADHFLKSELLCFFPEIQVNPNNTQTTIEEGSRGNQSECLNLLKIPPF